MDDLSLILMQVFQPEKNLFDDHFAFFLREALVLLEVD